MRLGPSLYRCYSNEVTSVTPTKVQPLRTEGESWPPQANTLQIQKVDNRGGPNVREVYIKGYLEVRFTRIANEAEFVLGNLQYFGRVNAVFKALLLHFNLKSSNHENNLNHLKAEKSKLDDSILHLQVTLGKSESSSKATICDMDNPLPMNDDEVNKQILQNEKSAADVRRGRGQGRSERPENVVVAVAMGDVQPRRAYGGEGGRQTTKLRGRGDGRGERPEAVAVTEKVVVVATKVAVVVAMGDVQPCGAYRSKRPRRKSKVRARGDGRSEVAVAITVAAWVTLKVAEGEEAQEGNENEGKN
ncbi:hypothetical protein Fmac_011494 [Flemingia macrophylla]|uniref:Uncharacterized protein n=1 Tax=Flemingia macrophylla TaxID=520843 RepID=A0ABD1MMK9_9FABA